MVILIILCICLSILFTYTDYKKNYKKALILKSCAILSIAFLSYLCFNINSNYSKLYFISIFLGIVFGFAGDFLLALGKIYISKNKICFLGGLSSFLVGHIFYIKAFTIINNINKYDFIFATIYLLIAYYISKKSKLNFRDLQISVSIYALVISFMLGKATSILFLNNKFLNIVVFIGALLFVISDSFLAFDTFKEKKNRLLSIYCHSSYFPAQIIFSLSVLFM